MKNKIIFGLVAIVAVVFVVGMFMLDSNIDKKKDNGQKQNSSETVEEGPVAIAQNDYAGAYARLTKVQNDVLEKMKILENHNYEVQKNNPTDYWADDNYYFVDFLPVAGGDLKYTAALNEVDNFEDIAAYIKGVIETDGYSEVSVSKKDNNDYIIKYSGKFTDRTTWKKTYGVKTIEAKYDAGKNRIKVNSTIMFNERNIPSNDFFYEFAEIRKGIYVLQNDTERLLVNYDDNGNIKEFYYSALASNEAQNMKVYFNNDEWKALLLDYGFDGTVYQIPNTDNLYIGYMANGSYKFFKTGFDEYGGTQITEISPQSSDYPQGDNLAIVGIKGFYDMDENSVYKNLVDIDKSWVFEANSFTEQIAYSDKILSIRIVNDFTNEVTDFSVIEKEVPVTENSTEETISE